MQLLAVRARLSCETAPAVWSRVRQLQPCKGATSAMHLTSLIPWLMCGQTPSAPRLDSSKYLEQHCKYGHTPIHTKVVNYNKCRLLVHNAGEVCVTRLTPCRGVCVCVCARYSPIITRKLLRGGVAKTLDQSGYTLRGRCLHLELCRSIWFGEYCSAVKVSTCNNPPLKV
jgi:hypothetical protein